MDEIIKEDGPMKENMKPWTVILLCTEQECNMKEYIMYLCKFPTYVCRQPFTRNAHYMRPDF